MTPETNKCRKNHTLTKLLEDDKNDAFKLCLGGVGALVVNKF